MREYNKKELKKEIKKQTDLIIFEEGVVQAFKHIIEICKSCIKGNKETIKYTKERRKENERLST